MSIATTPTDLSSFVRNPAAATSALSFPIDTVPGIAGELVRRGAEALGVPQDLIAAPVLSCAAGAIGRSGRLILKDGWEERAVLYLGSIALPGSGKTPALQLAMHGLAELQREAFARHQQAWAAWQTQLADWERATPATRGPKPAEPVLDHLYTVDSTMEALTLLLRDAPGLVLVQDELVGWVKGMDAYRAGGDRQRWLSLWSLMGIKVDRKSAPPLFVAKPAISVIGGVQPDLLPELHHEAQRRDGFIERILWSWPDTTPQGWSEATVPDDLMAAYAELFRRLRTTAQQGERTLRFESAAKERWVRWFNQNQQRVAATSGIAQGIAAKLPAQTARLALVLHCLQDPDGTREVVSAATLTDALRLAAYFWAHAQRVLAVFGDDPAASAVPDRVQALLEASDDWVSRTEMHHQFGRHLRAEALDAALAQLEAAGLAERRQVATAGRPIQAWRAVARATAEPCERTK